MGKTPKNEKNMFFIFWVEHEVSSVVRYALFADILLPVDWT